jgi:hypothetical protein
VICLTVIVPLRSGASGCVVPGDDLAAIVNQAPAGSTICILPGTYHPSASMNPASHVTIEGTSKRGKVQIRTKTLEVIFELGKASGVTIRNLTISGGVNKCAGTNCGPTGEGIHGGIDLTVNNVRIYHNGRAGIGGVTGLLKVTHSRVDHNGSAVSGPDYVSAGIKSVHPITVTDSRVDHNAGNGIHCDRDCGAFKVVRSDVEYNTLTGIHLELGRGPAVIANNTVRYNNLLVWLYHAGINVNDSKDTDIYGNVLGGNGHKGIHVWEDTRAGTSGYHLSNVRVHDNVKHRDGIGVCSLAGVRCY